MPFESAELKLQQFHMFAYYFYAEYFSKNSSKQRIIPRRLFFGLLRKEKYEIAKRPMEHINLNYFEKDKMRFV